MIDKIKLANEIKPIFEIGDKVICIESYLPSQLYKVPKTGKIYKILRFNPPISDEIVLEGFDGYSWRREKFRKVDEICFLMIKMGYNLGS